MLDLKTQFIEWLKTKPADERYNWADIENCACGQFFHDTGLPREMRPAMEGPDGLGLILLREPTTFGALLSRLQSTPPIATQTAGDFAAGRV